MAVNVEATAVADPMTRFRERMVAQHAEIFGPDNRWLTGEAVGHDPSAQELLRHYINSGAAATFDERHPELACQQ